MQTVSFSLYLKVAAEVILNLAYFAKCEIIKTYIGRKKGTLNPHIKTMMI